VRNLVLPEGPGVRMDTHIYENYEIPPFYDSLIGKLVVWGEDRDAAIRRMQKALSQFRVEGIKVTVPFHEKVFQDKDFIQGNIDTHFIQRLSGSTFSAASGSRSGQFDRKRDFRLRSLIRGFPVE